MERMKLSELAKLRHLNVTALNGRAINMMPLWEDSGWHLWIQKPDDTLMEMKVVDAALSTYWAKSTARPDDMWIGLLDLMWQRVSYPDIAPLIFAVTEDFHLLAASAAKLEHFHKHREDIGRSLAPSFVKSELEYILIVARSVFDLSQEVLSRCWNKYIILIDPNADAKRRKFPLPARFSKVLYHNNKARSAQELIDHYALPPVIAEHYVESESFFASLRHWRDHIIHGISRMDGIFVTEKGFCVSPKSKTFSDFPWKLEHRFNENIVSLKPWVAHIVLETMDACSALLGSFANAMQLPEEIAPGYRVFLRDPANGALARLLEADSGKQIWWSEEAEAPFSKSIESLSD